MLNLTKPQIEEKVSLVLTKRNIATPPAAAVKVFLDTSGSFRDEWEGGIVGLLAERVLAVASRFDDDGSLDVFHFNNSAYEVGSANFNTTDGQTYLNKNVLQSRRSELWGGTEFGIIVEAVRSKPVTKKVGGFFGFGGKTETVAGSTQPTLVYIVTDGENQDYSKADQMFNETKDENVYYMFVNVDTMARNAQKLADKYPHVGYVFIPRLREASDDTIIEALVTEEYAQWRAKFPA